MSRNSVLRQIHQALGEILVPAGYKRMHLDKETPGFVWTGSGVRQAFVVPFWEYPLSFQFSLTMCIRLDAVETITHLFSDVSPEYQASSDTCVVNLNAFVRGLDRLTVNDAATIQQAVQQLAPHINNEILPFLDRHRDIGSLDRLMNQSKAPGEVCGIDGRYVWFVWYAVHATIVAHLAQNPDFDKLVERYRQELYDFDDEERQRYEKVVQYLRSLR